MEKRGRSLSELLVGLGREFALVIYQWISDPIGSAHTTIVYLIPILWRTIYIGGWIIGSLWWHTSRVTEWFGVERWDASQRAKFAWTQARDHWIGWIVHWINLGIASTGAERVDWAQGPFIMVCNHQSYLDVALIVLCVPKSVIGCFVAKKEILGIPIIGQGVGWTQIIIDRLLGPEAMAEIRRMVTEMSDPCVIFFAEGTRSNTLGPFHKGFARIATEANFPVLPIAIDGTGAVCPRGLASLFALKPGGHTRITFGRPLSVSEVMATDVPVLVERVRNAVSRMLEEERRISKL